MSKARTIAVGLERFEIRDDGIASVFTDLIIESRLMGGVVCLSLGTLVIDGDVDAGLHQQPGCELLFELPLGGVFALRLRNDDGELGGHAGRSSADGGEPDANESRSFDDL